jgi:hypothetical protein
MSSSTFVVIERCCRPCPGASFDQRFTSGNVKGMPCGIGEVIAEYRHAKPSSSAQSDAPVVMPALSARCGCCLERLADYLRLGDAATSARVASLLEGGTLGNDAVGIPPIVFLRQ